MTTPPPSLLAPATEVCRITIDGPAGRADLAVPATTPLASVLPVLLQRAHVPSSDYASWSLQRLGEDALDVNGTPQTLGLRHGDLLWMRKAEEILPPLDFDDIADGVAHIVAGRTGRWGPGPTRHLSVAAGCLTLAAMAAQLLADGPGTLTGAVTGVIALVLVAACVGAARLGLHVSVSLVAGTWALVFGALAGLLSHAGSDGLLAPGIPGVLLSAGWVMLLAAALAAVRVLPLAVPATALLLALCAAVACGLSASYGWHGGRPVAVLAVALFALGHLAPRIALRMARLRAPQLPHNADELQADIDPQSEDVLSGRVEVAGALLDAISLSSGVTYLWAWWFLVHQHGWIGWVLPLVFSCAVLLGARQLNGVVQRMSTTLAGSAGLAVVLVVGIGPHGSGARFAVLAVLLSAAALLLAAAERLPTGRLLPVWGHLGDICEWLTVIALLPLFFQVLHAYAHFRSLAG